MLDFVQRLNPLQILCLAADTVHSLRWDPRCAATLEDLCYAVDHFVIDGVKRDVVC